MDGCFLDAGGHCKRQCLFILWRREGRPGTADGGSRVGGWGGREQGTFPSPISPPSCKGGGWGNLPPYYRNRPSGTCWVSHAAAAPPHPVLFHFSVCACFLPSLLGRTHSLLVPEGYDSTPFESRVGRDKKATMNAPLPYFGRGGC